MTREARAWDSLKARVRGHVPAGTARNIGDLARICHVTRKMIIEVEQDMDEMTMNVGVQVGSSAMNLPKRDWTIENLGDIEDEQNLGN